MTTLTIRNLNPETKSKLRILAAHNGRSMEEEARRILTRAVSQDKTTGLGTEISNYFKDVDDLELPIPPRAQTRTPPDL